MLRARRDIAVATSVGRALLQAREIGFVACSDLFLDAFDEFRQATAELSFARAAILTVARRNRPGFIATFDKDFRGQDGITVVPA